MSVAASALSGAPTSTGSPGSRNLAQVVCTRLLRTPLKDIAEAVGCDDTGASRIRANDRACTLNAWLRLMDLLGFKLVSKAKQCVPADELKVLRRAYAFIAASDELSARFAASEETTTLDWEEE
jgi:hypothetical protein